VGQPRFLKTRHNSKKPRVRIDVRQLTDVCCLIRGDIYPRAHNNSQSTASYYLRPRRLRRARPGEREERPVSVQVLSGAASFGACLRLFNSYPLAVTPSLAGGPERSMVLRHGAPAESALGGSFADGFTDGDYSLAGSCVGHEATYFVLSQDQASHFVLRPWNAPAAAGQPIRPAVAVPVAAHEVIANGMPVPRDGALLGWVTDRQASAILSVHHAGTGPQVRVLPLVGSEPLDWPPFAANPLADFRLWEYLRWGEIADLAPLLARHPGRVFWVPSQNRNRAAAAHGCVVVRESMTADDYWLAEGVYMDHWILRETVPVAPSAHLLTLPGTVDLTSRLSVGAVGHQ
jgi:hypothetical protein